jgi:flagellar hook assembly protein FlgD
MIPVTVPEGMRPEITLTNVVLSDLYGNTVPVRLGQTRVSVAAAPTSFSLATARPNPFNPSTTIAYEVQEQTHITLTIYNLLGQKVIRLVDQVQTAGRYEVVWHGVNSRGAGVASGVYLYRIVSGSGYTETKRMTLLK